MYEFPARVFAIVDCASFYASCERVFKPTLGEIPVVVLSNNDGCVIARSEEAKDLADMGVPYFQVRERLEQAGARVFSSNYDLYGDFSRRVMEVLGTFSDEVQIYSIDEAFLRLPLLKEQDLLSVAHEIRRRVLRWTGVPVRVGIGETKTLAKAAQALAKSRREAAFSLACRADVNDLLATLAVDKLWGIGRRYARFLTARGIDTALALRNQPDAWIRRHMSVTALRTVWELRGIDCLSEPPRSPRQSVLRSRSFGRKVTELPELAEAVATYASRAAEELRRHRMAAQMVQVFATTRDHRAGTFFTNTGATALPVATDFTPTLIAAAQECLKRIYRPGLRYAKAGVVLLNLMPADAVQGHLFCPEPPRHAALMQAVDGINRRMGTDTVYFAPAARDRRRAWAARSDMKSPSYTTRWSDLPTASAK
ncbi:MAG TPA: Y-family DNA polymerase [Rhodothermales bacterium]|nr:Y-family DNA polymerase [Rhodothermales bacterium]